MSLTATFNQKQYSFELAKDGRLVIKKIGGDAEGGLSVNFDTKEIYATHQGDHVVPMAYSAVNPEFLDFARTKFIELGGQLTNVLPASDQKLTIK